MMRIWILRLVGAGCVVLANACEDTKTIAETHAHEDAGEHSSTTLGTTVATSESTTRTATSAGRDTVATGAGETTRPAGDAALDPTSLDADARVETTSNLWDASLQDGSTSDAGVSAFDLPPANGALDYQLGGGYDLPDGVTIVSRDRTDSPAEGAYNICYVNGFQVQPGEEDDWEPDLLLRDDNGDVVIDEDWNEAILDISTADKRERIASTVGAWITQCASDGFQAVEIDNLDTYTRSDERIDEDDAVDFIARLSAIAHSIGLAIAQKNSVELVPRREEMGTDFVVSEECNAWEECDGYIESYGTHVLMIEYGREDFDRGCDLYGDDFSIVYRDKKLTRPTSNAYLYEGC